MEDVALSLFVGKERELAIAHRAGVFHDTTAAPYKSVPSIREAMEVENRYFVMTEVMGKRDWLSLARFVAFQLISCIGVLFQENTASAALIASYYKAKAICRILRSTFWGRSSKAKPSEDGW